MGRQLIMPILFIVLLAPTFSIVFQLSFEETASDRVPRIVGESRPLSIADQEFWVRSTLHIGPNVTFMGDFEGRCNTSVAAGPSRHEEYTAWTVSARRNGRKIK